MKVVHALDQDADGGRVGAAVAVTLLITLFASWAYGFTLNRVSLFALIFSIGILVDDAIVVGENIYAHRQMGKKLLRPGGRRGTEDLFALLEGLSLSISSLFTLQGGTSSSSSTNWMSRPTRSNRRRR